MDDSTASTNVEFAGMAPLLKIVQTLWKGKMLVIGGAAVCAVVSAAVSLVLPETYEASAALLLLPPRYKETEDAMSGLIPKVLEVQDYEVLLRSDGTLMAVVEKVKALGTWPEKDIESLSKISRLRERFWIGTKVNEKTAYGVRYSPAMVLRAQAGTAEQARDLAQAWGEVAVQTAAGFYQKGKTGLIDFVKDRYTEARTNLEQVYDEQRDIESKWDDEVARQQVLDKAKLVTRLEDDHAQAKVEFEAARKEVEEWRARLETEEQTLTLWKSPPMTAVFLKGQAPQGANPDQAPGEPDLKGYREEQVNPTYLHVQQQLADKEAQLKGLEEKERTLRRTLADVTGELSDLKQENAEYNCKSKRLADDAEAFGRSFDLLADKLEQAKIAESEQEALADIKLVSDAVLPDRKIAPRRSFIVVAATVLGFAVACAGTLLRDALSRTQPR